MMLQPFLLAGVMGLVQAGPAMPGAGDPFFLPPAARDFVHKAAMHGSTEHEKMQAVLRALFRPRADGGLGLTYDNSRTRTVQEVWEDGQANCLSMTAFYVMACRDLGLYSSYAEALNTNHWKKTGDLIRFERHVVALITTLPANDMIADFVPNLRKRFGTYVVAKVSEERFRALFYSNRAVEALGQGDLEGAKAQAELSLAADPKSSVGWNILGVVQGAQGELDQAEADYKRAMALDPQDGAPLGNMETLLRDAGRTGEAAAYQVLAEKVRKKDPFFHAFLADEALQAGSLDEALTRIRTAIKLLPMEADFHLLLARIRLAQGDLDGASQGIAQAKKLADPADQERYDGKLAYIQGLRAGTDPRSGGPRQ